MTDEELKKYIPTLYRFLPRNWNSTRAQLTTIRGKYDDLTIRASQAGRRVVELEAHTAKQNNLLQEATESIDDGILEITRLQDRVKTLTVQRDKHEHQSEYVTNMYVAQSLGITTDTPVTHLTSTVPLIPRRFRILEGQIVATLEYLYADNVGITKKTVVFPVKELSLIDN